MNVIIAGTRDGVDQGYFDKCMEEVCKSWRIKRVFSGGATGVDSQGEVWAQRKGLPLARFPADWAAYGKYAGPIRNSEMAKYANALVAFVYRNPNKSRGTMDMISKMTAKPNRIFIIDGDSDAGIS